MYRRYLKDEDYLSIISKESLNQMIRGNQQRFLQAEQAAEMSIVEYLMENYEIEAELNKGKYIAAYTRNITYPVGAHIELDNKIYKVVRSISGYKAPADCQYWEPYSDINCNSDSARKYYQFGTYYKNDVVVYNDELYVCLCDHGFDFKDIRIPLVGGWQVVVFTKWQPTKYSIWDVVRYNGDYYTLMDTEGVEENINPYDSDHWGAIADYCPDYNYRA